MEKKAIRNAYGEALKRLGEINKNVVVLDGDLSGSTMTKTFKSAFPERFFNMGIAEQNIMGAAAGLAIAGKIPFASTFAMFGAGRAFEIIRNSICYPKLNVKVEGVLISYHASGAEFLKNAKKYATKHADAYGHSGGGKALIDNFTQTFGAIFDNSIHTTTDFLSNGKVNIGGIDFEIIDNDEGYDIIIPEINAIYTHMLGHDCHSIVAGEQHANAIIDTLNGYIKLKEIAKICKNGEEFKTKVSQQYPEYSGQNYLDMTTGYFFPSK